ncbi:MAG: O-antigen ligase family protein [Candidatus Omnitrophica bacterium]|nr:O-antigen ligase family protein [Candidatus Omnitrophota bacterium]
MNYDLRVKLVDYMVIFIVFVIIALSPWPYGSVGLAWRYFICLGVLFAFVLSLFKFSVGDGKLQCSFVYLPVILFFANAVFSITYSIYRYPGIVEVLGLMSYLIVFFCLTQSLDKIIKIKIFSWGVVLTGLFYCIYGLLQYYGYFSSVYWAEPKSLSSRFVNSGPFGAYINMSLFLSLGLAMSCRRRLLKIVCLIFPAVFLVSLILSNSRISWLVFLLAAVLWGVLMLKNVTISKTKGFISVLGFVIILSCVLYYFRAPFLHRLQVASATNFQSLFQRADIWIGTLKLIIAHPFGAGLGAFSYIYPSFRIHSDRFFVEAAHSDFLQIFAETGVIGFGLFSWLVILLVLKAKRSFGESGSREKAFLCLGLFCAFCSLLLQALVDFPLQVPANALLFFVITGMLVSLTSFGKCSVIKLDRRVIICSLVAVVVCGGFFTAIYLANKSYLLAENKLKHMQLVQALSDFKKSRELMPLKAETYAGIARVYELKSGFGQERLEFQKKEISNLKQAIILNGYQADYWLRLAQAYAQRDKQKDALLSFRKAVELSPSVGAYYYPYEDYCLEHGLLNEALKVYQKSLSLFISDDGIFTSRYGDIQGVFDKIYNYTQDYEELKKAVPVSNVNNIDISLVFDKFAKEKGLAPKKE